MILQELLAIKKDGDYDSILKAAHFKKRKDHYHHPLHGIVTISKHGEWEHMAHGSKVGDGFGGTTESSLVRHLKKLQAQE